MQLTKLWNEKCFCQQHFTIKQIISKIFGRLLKIFKQCVLSKSLLIWSSLRHILNAIVIYLKAAATAAGVMTTKQLMTRLNLNVFYTNSKFI